MKLITKNSDYALRAIAYLAKRVGKFASSREISRSEKIPLLYLRRILQLLIRNKIVVSREGAGGGVCLVKNPRFLNVAGVIRMMQGDISLSECMFRKKACPNRSHCLLRKKIAVIEKKVNREFERISLSDLLEEKGE